MIMCLFLLWSRGGDRSPTLSTYLVGRQRSLCKMCTIDWGCQLMVILPLGIENGIRKAKEGEAKKEKTKHGATARPLRASARVPGSITKVPLFASCDRTVCSCVARMLEDEVKMTFSLTVHRTGASDSKTK
ncbi:hypothetical protein PIB30_054363 [Stylosanthes scabra]|uniref:Secreted protein n=1 Tax=Stylosanthes scabra TaxID=79078 RepID=A0ABU6ZHJ2_9FABA|nr:hypothetical protein [Stylosanthes scabra]